MFKVIVGHSIDVDSEDAIAQVLDQCNSQLQGQQPQASILFTAIDFDHALILSRIQDAFPGIALIGGTTDGEVSSIMGFQEDSITLMLLCSDTIEMRAGLGRNSSKDPAAAAQQAVNSLGLTDLTSTKLCIAIPDGLAEGTESALRQLQTLFPIGLPIVGGGTGDHLQFAQTYQFFQGEVLQNALPILVLCGDLKVSHGVASGWQPLSRKAMITKSNGSTVYEIDHQPATEFYKSYLGETSISGQYPLAVYEGNSDRFYLRASNQWDLEEGSMLFMGEVPEQAMVHITYAACDQIVAATQNSIEEALATYPGQQPAVVLLFSCAIRRLLLGHRTQEEYALCKESLNLDIPIFGFYTYGEIGPLEMRGETRFHQETLVTVLIGVE